VQGVVDVIVQLDRPAGTRLVTDIRFLRASREQARAGSDRS
jgi:hypothetical protein